MKLYTTRSKQWCINEIESIEAIISLPIVGISHPTQGGQQFRTFEDGLVIIGHLKGRIDDLDGVARKNPIRRGGSWGVRPW